MIRPNASVSWGGALSSVPVPMCPRETALLGPTGFLSLSSPLPMEDKRLRSSMWDRAWAEVALGQEMVAPPPCSGSW